MKKINSVSFHIHWRERAIKRRIDNKALKKKIKELTISRDKWKSKAMSNQEKLKNFSNSLKSIEKAFKKKL